MRVMLVHANYKQRGGEDAVVDSELELLRDHGHEVVEYRRDNHDIDRMPKLMAAWDTLWCSRTYREVRARLRAERVDVMHVHNTFPLISPSVYWAADAEGVPVVQTLHNFRILCPQAMLLREGRVCESCIGKAVPWPGVVHKCRGSLAESVVLTASLSLHRSLGTWRSKVTTYIALNDFCRRKMIEGGIPEQRVRIKPNFLSNERSPDNPARTGGLFVGRLSAEKGLDVLARAVAHGGGRPTVVGLGDLSGMAQEAFGDSYLGGRKLPEILDLMRSALYLVVPSIWYENFPRTIVEAFSCGLPVIASRLGAMAEIIENGVTGLLFEPGSAEDLAAKMAWADAHPAEMIEMGRQARERYERLYTPEVNHEELLSIYRDAISARAGQMLRYG